MADSAHEGLRDNIRAAALELWDKRINEAEGDVSTLVETRPELERGLLVDYVVVAVFDSGSDTHTVTATLRTDGKCASYRTVGLLTEGLNGMSDD